MNKDSSPRS